MTNLNTLTELTAEQQTFYDRALISRMFKSGLWRRFGQYRPITGKGRTINFRKFESLPKATTPLTEGVTPSGSKMVVSYVEATLGQYGDFISESDILIRSGIDPILVENAKVLGEQADETLDTITRDVVGNGTNVHYAGGGVTSDEVTANDKISSALIKQAVKILKKANAKPAVGEYFVCIVDPDTALDLQNDEEWIKANQYAGADNIIKGALGKLHGCVFMETNNTIVKANASGVNVHSTMFIGKDAYGVVDLKNSKTNKPRIIVKPVGSSGSADPLDQRGSQGWKADYAAVRLNELAMLRLEHAVTE